MDASKRLRVVAAAAVLCLLEAAEAQVSVKTPAQDVKAGGGITAIATDGGKASVTVGGIAGDADIQGVTVINGRVSIDGKEVPTNITRYKSPRTGTVYLIQRKGGAVSVTAEEGAGK